MSELNKRQIIRNAILEGGATKQSLMELAEVNAAGFASQLSYLRMEGEAAAEVDANHPKATFPMTDDKGIFFMGTYEQYMAAKATSKAPGVARTRTTEEALKFAQDRENKASAAYSKAEEKAKDGDEVFVAIAAVKKAEFELATLKLSYVQNADYQYEAFTIDDSKPAETDAPEGVEGEAGEAGEAGDDEGLI